MDEIKTMVMTMMDRIMELTVRAVDAERLAETYKANMVKEKENAAFWYAAYNRKDNDLKAVKEKETANDTNGD